jgi:hypothetical protein
MLGVDVGVDEEVHPINAKSENKSPRNLIIVILYPLPESDPRRPCWL